MTKLHLTLLLIFTMPFTAIQSQVTRHHGVFWGRLVLGDKITDKLKWEAYFQKRTQNVPGYKSIFEAPHFTSVWLWLNYSLSKNLKLSISPLGYFDSYAFLTKPEDVEIPGINEFRWVMRLEQEQKLKWFNYSNRYSIEYRRRDLNNNDVYLPNWRIRYQARLEKPFNISHPFSIFLADEIFLQFGQAVRGNPNVFDQNRCSIGLATQLYKNIRLSLSYLKIMQERNNGRDFDDANCAWAVLSFDNLFSQFRSK